MLTIFSQLLAQDTIKVQPGSGPFASLGTLKLAAIISGFVRLSLVIAALTFFFVLVIGGIRWILSGGDKANTEAARSQITAALIGLVIVFAAWAIIQLIDVFFDVHILEGITLPKAE